jgi:hypothetical protein
MTTRRFPAPWRVIESPRGFRVEDANGQTVGWFYCRDDAFLARQANVLTRDDARSMAANFARLPALLTREE